MKRIAVTVLALGIGMLWLALLLATNFHAVSVSVGLLAVLWLTRNDHRSHRGLGTRSNVGLE